MPSNLPPGFAPVAGAEATSSAPPGFTPVSDTQAPSAPPSSFIEKGIDMVPGMKARREGIAQQRYVSKDQPSDIPGITKGDRTQSFKDSSDSQASSPGMTMIGLSGPESALSMIKSAGKTLGAAGRGIADFLKPAAQRAEVLGKVKDIATLEPYVADKVSQATKAFQDSQITPRMTQQYAKATEQYVPFNKGDFLGIHPDIDSKVADLSKYYDTEIPMSKALELRADLNSNTLFKTAGPYAETQAARSKAYDTGNKLRESIAQVDPSVSQLSDELKDAYGLKKAVVGNSGKNPLNSILTNDGAAGLAKKGRLAAFDQQAGTDLSGLGKSIKTINDRTRPMGLSDVFSIHGPKQLASKLAAPVANTYDSLAASQLASPELSGSEKLRALLQKYSQGNGN